MNPADEHGMVDELLPWYANGSLDVATRRRIARHLESCAACREELKFLGDVRGVLRQSVAAEYAQTKVAGGFESLPMDLRQRVRAAPAPPLARGRSRFMMPAAAAVLFVAIALGVGLNVNQLEAPRFRTATTGGATAGEHVRVVIRFEPEAELNHINQLLRQHRAVIVQGPDAYDQWTLEIPVADEDQRQMLLTDLNGTHGIELARLAGSQSDAE